MKKRHLWGLLAAASTLIVAVQIGHARNGREAAQRMSQTGRYTTFQGPSVSPTNPNRPWDNTTTQTAMGQQTHRNTGNTMVNRGFADVNTVGSTTGMAQHVMAQGRQTMRQHSQAPGGNQTQVVMNRVTQNPSFNVTQNPSFNNNTSSNTTVGNGSNNNRLATNTRTRAQTQTGTNRALSVPKVAAVQWTPGQATPTVNGTQPSGVFFWSYVQNRTGAPQQVSHVWYEGNRVVKQVELPVPQTSGRVYSTLPLQANQQGPFRVEVRSPRGDVLRQMEFNVGRG